MSRTKPLLGPAFGLAIAAAALAACGPRNASPEAQAARAAQAQANAERAQRQSINDVMGDPSTYDRLQGGSVFDLFRSSAEPQRQIGVNRYIWTAALDVLSFLPLEGADPFSGVIVTDWGRIGGDPTPFRVTVFVSEAALDARSLRVAAFRQQGGRAVAVSEADNRRLEDAILTRARQLRIAGAGR